MAAKHPPQAEGHITHDTAGRINVERGKESVTLRLWQWSLAPTAVLSFAEAEKLIEKIQAAMAPAPSAKTLKPIVAAPPEDNSDLA